MPESVASFQSENTQKPWPRFTGVEEEDLVSVAKMISLQFFLS